MLFVSLLRASCPQLSIGRAVSSPSSVTQPRTVQVTELLITFGQVVLDVADSVAG